MRDQFVAAGVPFFFKQWGEWGPSTKEVELTPRLRLYSGLYRFADGQTMIRFGKRIAGRLLDGREWNEFPEARYGAPGQ
jgi:protein gp37